MLCASIVLFSQFVFADEIILAADPWCPYDCEANSDKPGFMIEIAQSIFEKAGHQVTYKVQPWARVLKNTKDGKINGAVGAFISDAPDCVFSTEELGLSTTFFYGKKGTTWKYSNIASLEGKTVGVIRGYSYGEALDAYVKKHQKNSKKVQLSNTLDSLAKKLLKGRIDIFPEDSMVAGFHFQQNNIAGEFQKVGLLNEAEKVYIAFSPKLESSKNYVKLIDSGMKALRKSGELSKILARYGLKDWK